MQDTRLRAITTKGGSPPNKYFARVFRLARHHPTCPQRLAEEEWLGTKIGCITMLGNLIYNKTVHPRCFGLS